MDDSEIRTARLSVVIAEYEYVTGLIPMYREMESRALAMVGLLFGGLATLVAAMQQAQFDVEVQGMLVATSSWILLVVGAVEITSILRIMRASNYLKNILYPAVEAITGNQTLKFETAKFDELFVEFPNRFEYRLRKNLITSGPISFGIGLAGLVVSFLGVFGLAGVRSFADLELWAIFSIFGGFLGLLIGIYGYWLSTRAERTKS
jgi:uncharacterized membrane protein YidH (DUF202 family)